MLLIEYDIDKGPARRLPSPGSCIYCGAKGPTLTDEHVIPFAIGRDATILERSCCEVCQRIIQPYEQAVLRHQLGYFRAMVESPTRKKKERPVTIPLEFVEVNEKGETIRELGKRDIPLGEAPLILDLWESPPPTIFNIPIDPSFAKGKTWRYIESEVANPILRSVAQDAGVPYVGFKLRPVNRLHYLRTLAKIAHAYAVAELGTDAFDSFLTAIILNESDNVARYVGDLSGVASLEGATGQSFKITLGEVPEEAGIGKGIIVVFMQFWADLGSPPHLVVVGKSLRDLQKRYETNTSNRVSEPVPLLRDRPTQD